jgi:hypothetical protein
VAGAAAGAQAASKPTINNTPSTTLKLCFIALSFEDWIFHGSVTDDKRAKRFLSVRSFLLDLS